MKKLEKLEHHLEIYSDAYATFLVLFFCVGGGLYMMKSERDNPLICREYSTVESILSIEEYRGKNWRTHVTIKLENGAIVKGTNISVKKGDTYCSKMERKYPNEFPYN